MTNDSLVPAKYKALLRKADSPFEIAQAAGELAPGECREFNLTCCMDDAIKSTNDLIFQVVNAAEQVVALTALGFGATITASRELKTVDLGEHFSSRLIRIVPGPRLRPICDACSFGSKSDFSGSSDVLHR